jgi:phosphinothricin acetyltransferase
MSPITLRPAVRDDLPRLTEIYNHYVVNTPVTFDLQPFSVEQRIPWFNEHSSRDSRHRMIVAVEPQGKVVGYATTGRFRPKEAYETTVESSIYCDPNATGCGIGTELYRALFESIQGQDINRIVGGVTQPNVASVALHKRFGFQHVGTFTGNGRKFDCYWDVAWFERPLKL